MSTTETATSGTGGQPANSALEQAFEVLKKFDTGFSRAELVPIDEAVRASLKKSDDRPNLERKLLALLTASTSILAHEYICGQIALLGSAASVKALAGLLPDAKLTHAASAALAVIPAAEAATALREALPRLAGAPQVAVIHALGLRRDVPSVPLLAPMLANADKHLQAAAAAALGEIGTQEAAQALRKHLAQSPNPSLAVADAVLVCVERLIKNGDRSQAVALCESLATAQPPNWIREATQRAHHSMMDK